MHVCRQRASRGRSCPPPPPGTRRSSGSNTRAQRTTSSALCTSRSKAEPSNAMHSAHPPTHLVDILCALLRLGAHQLVPAAGGGGGSGGVQRRVARGGRREGRREQENTAAGGATGGGKGGREQDDPPGWQGPRPRHVRTPQPAASLRPVAAAPCSRHDGGLCPTSAPASAAHTATSCALKPHPPPASAPTQRPPPSPALEQLQGAPVAVAEAVGLPLLHVVRQHGKGRVPQRPGHLVDLHLVLLPKDGPAAVQRRAVSAVSGGSTGGQARGKQRTASCSLERERESKRKSERESVKEVQAL